MRLLLLNPNTNAAMTERVLSAAWRLAPPGMELQAATARFGAEVIASRASYAIAGHAALDAYAASGKDCDAILLACFGDPGLAALREIAHCPVVGMAEAACFQAAHGKRRFSIITGGARWPAMLREYVQTLGLGSQLASVRALAADGAGIMADPAAAQAAILHAAKAAGIEDGAEAIVLGGAAMAGMVNGLATQIAIPVIDGLSAAMLAASYAAQTAAAGLIALEPTATHGLSPALAGLLAKGSAKP